MTNIIMSVVSGFFAFVNGLNTFLLIAILIGHWVGQFFVAFIFVFAILATTNELSLSFDYVLFQSDSWVLKVIALFENPTTWVAATAIIATTVAMGHFRTLDLNIEKAAKEALNTKEQ